ncbi:MAG: Crp/Fnr family transcriptional regulator [Acidimicrobiales bacterium]
MPSAGLADGDFLRRLTEIEAKSLEARSRRKSYARGTIIFRDGDQGGEALVLRAGRVKVSARRRSREVILAVLDPGSLLGEVSAIDGGPRSATVVALEPVEVDAIGADDFVEFLAEHPRVAGELLQLVVARLRDASLRQVEFGTVDTLGRLCVSLIQLADRYGRPLGEHVEVDAPINQQEIAEWAGMSREAVVKGLRQLRSLGWLTVDARVLTLLDPPAIRRRAGQR